MKRIGYILKYNEDEQKGILVYGHWKEKRTTSPNAIRNNAIKFTFDDCKTIVKTGNLVYFELTDSRISNIERASIVNFDRKLIDEITSWKEGYHYDWYYYNTHIVYENLKDIIIPYKEETETEYPSNNEDSFDDESLLDLLEKLGVPSSLLEELEEDEEDDLFWKNSQDKSNCDYSFLPPHLVEPVNLPDKIDDLINYFGKYEHPAHYVNTCNNMSSMNSHYYSHESISIDILDISLWIDESIPPFAFNSLSFEFVSYLCNTFVYRKRIDETGNVFIPKEGNYCISASWNLILSKLSIQEIRQVISIHPILQPALPFKFCLENLDILSEKYGMPDVTICKVFNEYQIIKANTASDYNHLHKNFAIYTNRATRHIPNEGVPMCEMGKLYISELQSKLENQLENVIAVKIKSKFAIISGINFDSLLFTDKEEYKKVLLSVGLLIEAYEDLDDYYHSINETFNKLPDTCKEALYTPIYLKINKTTIEYSKNEETTPSKLGVRLHFLKDWLDESTLKRIYNIVNIRFSQMNELKELKEAYNYNLITAEQYYDGFRKHTKDYNIHQFINEILDRYCFEKSLPTTIQWYIISNIINWFNFKSLNSYKYVKIDNYKTIYDIKSLLKWINSLFELGNVDKTMVIKAENELLSILTEKDKWCLFEEGLVSTPGADNIKTKLNQAYKNKHLEEVCFKRECFQDAMCKDCLTTDDKALKFLIAEHLDSKHQKELQGKCEGVLQLYLWLQEADENYDWNLITSFFSELPEEQQIMLFRYIFYLMANKRIKLSIDDLYDLFATSIKKTCPTILWVLCLLKDKFSISHNTTNNLPSELYSIESSFFSFFFPCNGHLSLTLTNQDRSCHTYNGYIKKIVIQDKEYYSIHFYDVPHDVCNHRINWQDNKDIIKAQKILETNIINKKINSNYLIDISEEVAIKQFIMAYGIDDRCCLLDDKQAMIEKGWLAPNNSYQPLYTNYIRPYDDEWYYVCRCTNFVDVDSTYGIPFYWCNKKPCVRRCHYIQPISDWKEYKLPDFIYILLGCDTTNLDKVWKITSEISQTINNCIEHQNSKTEDSFEHNEEYRENIQFNPIKDKDEIGVLTEKLSIVQDIFDDEEDEDCDNSDYYEDSSQSIPTYNKYAGSYAQDEMGYSDDDIDTIFDGDPDAYWNID